MSDEENWALARKMNYLIIDNWPNENSKYDYKNAQKVLATPHLPYTVLLVQGWICPKQYGFLRTYTPYSLWRPKPPNRGWTGFFF